MITTLNNVNNVNVMAKEQNASYPYKLFAHKDVEPYLFPSETAINASVD